MFVGLKSFLKPAPTTHETFHFLFTHHCRLVHRALAGVAVARALPADGDVPEAVEVLPQGQLVEEVVGSGRILWAHSQPLHSDANEPGQGEVDEGAGGPGRSGPPIHETEIGSSTFIQGDSGGLILIWKFHHLVQFPSRFCQVPVCPSRTGQTVE